MSDLNQDEKLIIEVLFDSYNLSGQLTPLWGEVEKTFLLKEKSGHLWIVKYSKGLPQKSFLQEQTEVLEFLKEKNLLIKIPVLHSSKEQAFFVSCGKNGYLRVLNYIKGDLFVEKKCHEPWFLKLCGQRLGELDYHLAFFQKKPEENFLKWDVRKALWLKEALDSLQEGKLKNCIKKQITLFESRYCDYEIYLRKTWIHGDVNDYNLIVDNQEIGLIDFGDVIYSYHAANLAIAMTYLSMDAKDILSAMSALVSGYTKKNKLEERELCALYLLIKIRLSISLVISEIESAKKPDDPYVLVSRKGAIRMLEFLEQVDEQVFNGRMIAASKEDLKEKLSLQRSAYFSPALKTSYASPLVITKGQGCWLYDAGGKAYLDCVNNVAHVGHSHPRIKAAALKQLELVNTNSRYLSQELCAYGEKLTGYFSGLECCFFVSSGSEAVELALWLARVYTQKSWDAVIDHAYHGHTQKLIQRSTYKKNPFTHYLDPVFYFSCPDAYRILDEKILNDLDDELAKLFSVTEREGLSAFLCESMMSCAGQLIYPKGYLKKIFDQIQSRGSLCIVDEIQTGLGRAGNVFSNYENEDVQPDIVTLGKALGNGYPLAAVLTRRDIGDAFASKGFEFFSSFGGCGLSARIGLEVCQIIEEESLQQNALETGNFLLKELKHLQQRYPILADIRGRGLFVGIEFTYENKAPLAKELVAGFVEKMKHSGILLSQDGVHRNVIKIKPPMVFGKKEAERLLEAMDRVLSVSAY